MRHIYSDFIAKKWGWCILYLLDFFLGNATSLFSVWFLVCWLVGWLIGWLLNEKNQKIAISEVRSYECWDIVGSFVNDE